MKQTKSKLVQNKVKEPKIDINKIIIDTKVFLGAIKKAVEGESVKKKTKPTN